LLAVTTHYEPLKAYSLRDPRLRSASVGFDVDRMEPTFALTLDVPGASSALLVAKRFGIPDGVLEFARRVLPEQARDFETLVRELHSRVHALDAERVEVAREQAALAALRMQEQVRLEKQKRLGDSRIERELADLLAQVKAARAELDRARADLRTEEATRKGLASIERRVDAVAARVALGGDLLPKPAPSSAANPEREPISQALLVPGAKVHVPHLRSDAVVIEGPSKGRVRVAVGPLKLWVPSTGLAASQAAPTPAPATLRTTPAHSAERTSDNTLNLRGMRVDDALGMLESFVDRLSMTDMRVGYVVHGHGSGALREAIRQHLRNNLPQVRDCGAAATDEGGDAITVFALA
jgi:DNA mismatch repair protein MutS2